MFSADPTASDFLAKSYTIKWTSELPGSWANDNDGYSYQNHQKGFVMVLGLVGSAGEPPE